MDHPDDFKPRYPYDGELETTTDLGPLGVATTVLTWHVRNDNSICITQANVKLGSQWYSLGKIFEYDYASLRAALEDKDWVKECKEQYDRLLKRYEDAQET